MEILVAFAKRLECKAGKWKIEMLKPFAAKKTIF
jgi:hypothetical protein